MLQLHLRRAVAGLALSLCVATGAQESAAKVKAVSTSKAEASPKGKAKHANDSAAGDAHPASAPKDATEKDKTAYAFSLPTAEGKDLRLSDYKGKVLLVVNLGRSSSYATQLPALEKLSDTFKDKGLIVLGVPSNDFGSAEPGTPAEIAKFYADAKVNFPVMQASSLTGVHELPLFAYLAKNKAVENDGLHWNYTKFLVDRQGKVIVCFPPEIAPDSLAMMATVQEVLDGTWKPKKPEKHEDHGDDDDDE